MSSPSLPACSAKDRALLLALALKWKKESKTSSLTPDEVQQCEREIWVEHIHAAMEASNVSSLCSHSVSVRITLRFHYPYNVNKLSFAALPSLEHL